MMIAQYILLPMVIILQACIISCIVSQSTGLLYGRSNSVSSYRLILSHSTIHTNFIHNALSLHSSKGDDDIFGAEFNSIPSLSEITTSTTSAKDMLRGKPKVNREEVMKGFQNLRLNYFLDSALVSVLGLSVVWYAGTYKDALSYGLGSVLGLFYFILLGRYVERIGTSKESKASDGLRFLPVILLVGLYSKFQSVFSIIPEIAGFIVSYQLSGFLQIFNENPYNENEN